MYQYKNEANALYANEPHLSIFLHEVGIVVD